MTGRRLPLAGHAFSLTGNMLTVIALPLHVLDSTDSAAATGLVAAVAPAPVVLGGALGGVLVDRIGHRVASVAADLVSAVTVSAAIPFGAVIAGLTVDRVGATAALVVVGTAYLLVALVPLGGGPFRGMDPAPGPGTEVASTR